MCVCVCVCVCVFVCVCVTFMHIVFMSVILIYLAPFHHIVTVTFFKWTPTFCVV